MRPIPNFKEYSMSPTDIPTIQSETPEVEVVVKPSRTRRYMKNTLLYVVAPVALGTTVYLVLNKLDGKVTVPTVDTTEIPLPE
jgi:hypothetical protein